MFIARNFAVSSALPCLHTLMALIRSSLILARQVSNSSPPLGRLCALSTRYDSALALADATSIVEGGNPQQSQ